MKKAFVTAVLSALLVAGWSAPGTAHAAAPPNRVKAGAGGLYDSVTGRAFTPRGVNYVRLATTPDGRAYHSTFEPGRYDAAAVRAFLDSVTRAGYNTVRVFIDPGEAAGTHGIVRGLETLDPFHPPYLDNVADFVEQAAARGVYVMPAFEWFPANRYYWGIAGRVNGADGAANISGFNGYTMEKGRVAAKAAYLRNFASGLLDRIGTAGASAILAYQTDNEHFFEADEAPFNRLGGTVKPVDGLTYDMSKPAERQQAADASLVEYSRQVKAALLEADPGALMTTGFFTNRAVGKSRFDGLMTYCSTACSKNVDYRVPGRAAALSRYGAADFIDVHVYPTSVASVPDDLASIELSLFAKPYIVGEFGARKSAFGNSVVTAAYAMRDTQKVTCRRGAKGWLFWTWDTYENLASQDLFYKLTETGGAVNGQLAPIVRPDPCA